MIPQRFPCEQSGEKCFVAVLEQEQTGVSVPSVSNLEIVFQAFVMMAGNSLIWKKEGAKKEHVLKISLLAKIFTVLTAGPCKSCVDKTISICLRRIWPTAQGASVEALEI